MRQVAVLVVVVLLAGCASRQRESAVDASHSERWRKADEAIVNVMLESARNSGQFGRVAHVVLLWLKTPGDAAAIDKIIQTSREFRQIPGVISIKAGRPIPSTRPVVDSSYDVGLVMMFADEAALQAYETHPQHVKAVHEVLRPLAAKFQVYDIKEADASTAPASKSDTD